MSEGPAYCMETTCVHVYESECNQQACLHKHPEWPVIPTGSLVPSEAFVVPLEDPNDPSADEWARLGAANADEDARAEGYKDGFQAGVAHAARSEATVKAEALEQAAEEIIIPGASSLAASWLQGRAARLRAGVS